MTTYYTIRNHNIIKMSTITKNAGNHFQFAKLKRRVLTGSSGERLIIRVREKSFTLYKYTETSGWDVLHDKINNTCQKFTFDLYFFLKMLSFAKFC